MATTAITPPTMIATIGIKNGPKPRILSITSMRHLLRFGFGPRRMTNDQRRFSGGADRDRTGGLLVANQALSQLSYSPKPCRSSLVIRRSQIRFANDQRRTTNDRFSGGPG